MGIIIFISTPDLRKLRHQEIEVIRPRSPSQQGAALRDLNGGNLKAEAVKQATARRCCSRYRTCAGSKRGQAVRQAMQREGLTTQSNSRTCPDGGCVWVCICVNACPPTSACARGNIRHGCARVHQGRRTHLAFKVQGPAARAPPGSLLEMQNLGLHC